MSISKNAKTIDKARHASPRAMKCASLRSLVAPVDVFCFVQMGGWRKGARCGQVSGKRRVGICKGQPQNSKKAHHCGECRGQVDWQKGVIKASSDGSGAGSGAAWAGAYGGFCGV